MEEKYPVGTRYYQKAFKEIILQEKQDYMNEYHRVLYPILEKSSAKYKGEPAPFLYNPFILNKSDHQYLSKLTDNLCSILNKIILHYLKDEKFRRLFPFQKEMEEYILIDPGYACHFPIARFDYFWNGENDLKFCEFNTDGTTAMNEVRVIQDIVGNSKAVTRLKKDYDISLEGFELFDSLIDNMLLVYKEFSKNNDSFPSIAIVDFEQEGTIAEFQEFQKYMSKRGIVSCIADPRELEYRSGKLYYKDDQIDMVYRRATTQRIFEEYHDIQPFLKAYRDHAFCMFGSFRSQIIHNKALFGILTKPENLPFLKNTERDFLLDHIPETNYLTNSGELLQKLKDNKDSKIIKPCDKSACRGVYAGCDHSIDKWNELLDKAVDQDYLCQDYCIPPRLEMLSITQQDMDFKDFNYIMGLFIYNNKLQGLYNRAGSRNIIGALVECFTAPVYIIS